MPTRVVRGEIVKSQSLARVSLEAELLFRNLIALADDFGRYDGDAEILAAHAYPRRRSVTVKKLEGWLAELVSADGDSGPVELYFVDGRRYLRLVNWEKHRGKSRRGALSRWPDPLMVEGEIDSTASAEIRGNPRGSARGVEESGSRGVGESGKDIARETRVARRGFSECPDCLPESDREGIREWAANQSPPIPASSLGAAWEEFRDYAISSGRRYKDWPAAFRGSLRRGFGLPDSARPAGRESAAQRRERETIEAATAVGSGSTMRKRRPDAPTLLALDGGATE